jgi:peptide/nickel transport system substrate-binding protein
MTQFRVSLALVVAGATAAALTGCSGGNSSPQPDSTTLHVGSTAVSTLNYAKSNAGYASGLGELVLEPLLVLNDAGSLSPWLAQSWSQSSPTTYVYHLRHGVKFSDGNELTAKDAAFSLNFYRRTGSADQYNFPTDLKSITAPDRYTVQVTLTHPDAAWAVVPAASQLGIFERKFYEGHQSTFGQPGTGVVGTGPWQLTSLDPTTGAELSANPHYWGGKPAISNVSWKFFSSESNEALAFRAGDVDAAFPAADKSFATTAGTKLVTAPGAVTVGALALNVLSKPWNDVHVRRAVAYALDKPALINAYGGYATPQDTLITSAMLQTIGSPSQVSQALAAVPPYAYDLSKAKAEMAASSYPNGTTATLVTDNGAADVNISQAIVAQLQRIGIHATLKVQDSAALTSEWLGKDRPAVPSGFSLYGAVSMDPGEGFDYALGSKNATAGNWNSTNWSTPTFDRLLAAGFATSDSGRRLGVYQHLLTELADSGTVVPIFLSQAAVALSSTYTWPTFSSTWQLKAPWALGLKRA